MYHCAEYTLTLACFQVNLAVAILCINHCRFDDYPKQLLSQYTYVYVSSYNHCVLSSSAQRTQPADSVVTAVHTWKPISHKPTSRKKITYDREIWRVTTMFKNVSIVGK